MEVAGSTAAGADGEIAREMRFRGRCEGCHLLVPHMDPFNVAATAYDISEPVQAVTNDAIDALNTCGNQRLNELICDGLRHVYYSLSYDCNLHSLNLDAARRITETLESKRAFG
jgi:hypothetical protein